MENACCLVNRPPSSVLEDKTPHEVWTGRKPFLSHLRVFGCHAYVHVPKDKEPSWIVNLKGASLFGIMIF